jgi:hypothetical protein
LKEDLCKQLPELERLKEDLCKRLPEPEQLKEDLCKQLPEPEWLGPGFVVVEKPTAEHIPAGGRMAAAVVAPFDGKPEEAAREYKLLEEKQNRLSPPAVEPGPPAAGAEPGLPGP